MEWGGFVARPIQGSCDAMLGHPYPSFLPPFGTGTPVLRDCWQTAYWTSFLRFHRRGLRRVSGVSPWGSPRALNTLAKGSQQTLRDTSVLVETSMAASMDRSSTDGEIATRRRT